MRSGARVKTVSREEVTIDLLKAYGELAQYSAETEEPALFQEQGTAVLTARQLTCSTGRAPLKRAEGA